MWELLNISLDGSYNFQNATIRSEGFGLLVQVRYQNFVEYSLPNKLPMIYEYRFSMADFQTFKTNSVMQARDADERVIDDWHGMFVRTHQVGKVGFASWQPIIWMVLETSFIFSVVRWLIQVVALNWFKGRSGDALEHVIKEQYEMDFPLNDDGGEGTSVLYRKSALGMQLVEVDEEVQG